MGVVIHLDAVGSSNPQGSGYLGSFTNWTALNVAYPSANTGDFAVTEDAEGTAWLPWTLGGTYYPQGTYYWDGVKWSSNVEDIAEKLQELSLVVTQIAFVDSPYSATWGEDLEVDCSGGVVVINLPTAIGNNGDIINVTKIDSSVNVVTIDAFTTQTINGQLTQTISNQWDSAPFKSNNTNIGIR